MWFWPKSEVSQITAFMLLPHLELENKLPKIKICDQISPKRAKTALGVDFTYRGPRERKCEKPPISAF